MVRLVLEGVDAFTQALEKMPVDFAAQAHGIVYETAAETVRDLSSRGLWPPRDPQSRSRFQPLQTVWSVQPADKGPLRPRAKVQHFEILAQWWEEGTKPRVTKKGWNRGAMPATPTAVPIFVWRRRQMNDRLVQLAESIGLTVTGG